MRSDNAELGNLTLNVRMFGDIRRTDEYRYLGCVLSTSGCEKVKK